MEHEVGDEHEGDEGSADPRELAFGDTPVNGSDGHDPDYRRKAVEV
jgi:hypothetical protein